MQCQIVLPSRWVDASKLEADQARAEKIRAIARGYYMELPVALADASS